MLHEILLALVGAPSPLFAAATTTVSEPASAANDGGGGDDKGNGSKKNNTDSDSLFLAATLTPPERALLSHLARLAAAHAAARRRATAARAAHPSPVCRAVAAAVVSVHLAAFERAVLEVESEVLRRDAGLVGARTGDEVGVVPLSALVARFAPWARRLKWLAQLMRFVAGGQNEYGDGDSDATDSDGDGDGDAGGDNNYNDPTRKRDPLPRRRQRRRPASGAVLIDHLRAASHTGYTDLEALARALTATAEAAWVRQLALWLLYGHLPDGDGGADFFIRETSDHNFVLRPALMPRFVAPATAQSALFIGKSLNHLRARDGGGGVPGMGKGIAVVASPESHPAHTLATLRTPISTVALSTVVASLRRSLSASAMAHILPLPAVVAALELLHDFFLLGRGDFAAVLVEAADEVLAGRHKRMMGGGAAGGDLLSGVVVSDAEVAAVLAHVWERLAAQTGVDGEEDEQLEQARAVMRLSLVKPKKQKKKGLGASTSEYDSPDNTDAEAPKDTNNAEGSPAAMPTASSTLPFSSLLLGTPTTLSFNIRPPLDLFFSPDDLATYSRIHVYLLAIHRGHTRLTRLWTCPVLRRTPRRQPPVRRKGLGGGSSGGGGAGGRGGGSGLRSGTVSALSTASGGSGIRGGSYTPDYAEGFLAARERDGRRARAMRPVWATVRVALLLLAELLMYMHGEVVGGGWAQLRAWMVGEGETDDGRQQLSAKQQGTTTASPSLPTSTYDEPQPATSSPSTSLSPSPSVRTSTHDPESLTTAHRAYLATLTRALLLQDGAFMAALHELLVRVDALGALAGEALAAAWEAVEMEVEFGVVDTVDGGSGGDGNGGDGSGAAAREREVQQQVRRIRHEVEDGVRAVVARLRAIDGDGDGGEGGGGGRGGDYAGEGVGSRRGAGQGQGDGYENVYGYGGEYHGRGKGVGDGDEEGRFVPRRPAGVDRVLMKLDFDGGFDEDGEGDGVGEEME